MILPDQGGESAGLAVAASRVARNAVYLALADIANKVMSFVYFLLVARRLDTDGFGVFSSSLALIMMFSVLTDLGLGQYLTREVARRYPGAGRMVGAGFAMRIAASAAVMGLAIAVAYLLRYNSPTVVVIAVMSLFVLTNSLALLASSVFQGLEHNSTPAVIRSLQSAVMLAFILFLPRSLMSAGVCAVIYVTASGLGTLLMLATLKSHFDDCRLLWDLDYWRRMARTALPFSIGAILVSVYYWNGAALLSRVISEREAGLYGAAYRLVIGSTFAAGALSSAVYPLLARSHLGSVGDAQAVLRNSLRLMTAISLGSMAIITALAGPLMQLFYGGSYAGALQMLRVLAVWGAAMSLNLLLSAYFAATDRVLVMTVQAGVSCVLNIALNLLMIPKLGGLGAAVSIASAETVGCLFMLSRMAKSVGVGEVLAMGKAFVKVALTAAVSGLVLVVLSKSVPVAAVATAVPLYFVLLLVTGVVRRSDLSILAGLATRGQR